MTPWANTTVYPAGGNPWNTQVTKVAPNYTYFTPGQVPAAEELNYILNARDVVVNAAVASSINFGAQVDPSGFTTVRSATYDPFKGLWLLGGGTNPALAFNYGGDSTLWATGALGTPGSGGYSVVSLDVSPAGANYLATVYNGSTIKDYYSTDHGATWTNITTFSGTTSSIEYLNFAGVTVVAGGGSGANSFLNYYATPDGTPSNTSALSSITCTEWLLKAAPALAMAIPRAASATTYYTSTSGATWTSRTFPTSVVNTGDTPYALTYDDVLGQFVLVVLVNGGPPTVQRVAVSSDGVAWSVVKTFAGTGTSLTASYVISDISSIQGILVGVTTDNVTVAPASASGITRVVYSADGGVTWGYGPTSLTGGTTATQRPRIRRGNGGLLIHNSVNVRLGNAVGFTGAL